MPFEKCPECGKWLVNYDFVRQEKKCFNPDCNYSTPYPKEQYLREHDVLPKLARSIGLR